MKKYLIVLVAALALISCGKEGGSKYTQISFKDKELTLAQGETAKLKVRWEPTTIEVAPSCVWASSDEEVVAVDQNGNIQALEIGEANITATYGEGDDQLKAVCHVTVKSIYDMLEWGNLLVSYDDEDETTKIGEPYEVEASNGTKYTVQLYQCTWYLCDQYVEYVSEQGLVGAGFMSFIDAPIEVITKGDYKGYYWTNELVFEDLDTDSAGVCPTGKLTDAEEWYKYITDSTYKGDGSFEGAAIHYVDWDNKKEYDYLGFIKNGFLGDYSDGIFYRMNITWLGGVYGLEYDEEADDFVKPATFAENETKMYELLPEQESAKKSLVLSKKTANLKDYNTRSFQKNVLIRK